MNAWIAHHYETLQSTAIGVAGGLWSVSILNVLPTGTLDKMQEPTTVLGIMGFVLLLAVFGGKILLAQGQKFLDLPTKQEREADKAEILGAVSGLSGQFTALSGEFREFRGAVNAQLEAHSGRFDRLEGPR